MGFRAKIPMPWDILVFLAITTLSFMFSFSRLMQDQESKVTLGAPGAEQTAPLRAPASALETEIQRGSKSAHGGGAVGNSQTMDLGCLERLTKERFNFPHGSVRLKGTFCAAKSKRGLDSIRVRNITNGYEGTIFYHGHTAFSTDYIVLQTGKNLVEIEWKPTGGPSRLIAAEFSDH